MSKAKEAAKTNQKTAPKTQKAETSRATTSKLFAVITHDYLVLKNLLAALLIFCAFLIVYPVVIRHDWPAITLLILGGIVLLGLLAALIHEFILKVARIQQQGLHRYSLFVSLNTVLGLTIPLVLINIVLRKLIFLMRAIPNYDTWICDMRFDIIRYYFRSMVSAQISELAFYTAVIAIALFVFGGLFERHKD